MTELKTGIAGLDRLVGGIESGSRNILYDDIVNIDIMTAATQKDAATQRATDLDLNKAHNILFFRFNEERCQRELRIVKMEGCEHPLEWISFKITGKGIQLVRKK